MQEISREVIKKAADGDIRSFEIIFREHFSFVSRVVLRVVNDSHEAEEVAQEVFMSVYRYLKNFRFDSSFKTWLYRISINCAVNYAKKKNRKRRQEVAWPENMDAAASVTREGESELEQDVFSLLDVLSPEYRTCLILRGVEGLSYQEIADVLKIPINTVRSRLKRAREILLAKRREVAKHEL